jgi:AmiR/NasT family two-component response regulator
VIDQAIGILIGRHQMTASEAFDLMRRQSQRNHREVRDIANELLTQATSGPPEPGRPFDYS